MSVDCTTHQWLEQLTRSKRFCAVYIWVASGRHGAVCAACCQVVWKNLTGQSDFTLVARAPRRPSMPPNGTTRAPHMCCTSCPHASCSLRDHLPLACILSLTMPIVFIEICFNRINITSVNSSVHFQCKVVRLQDVLSWTFFNLIDTLISVLSF